MDALVREYYETHDPEVRKQIEAFSQLHFCILGQHETNSLRDRPKPYAISDPIPPAGEPICKSRMGYQGAI
jgi:hypothetical protein